MAFAEQHCAHVRQRRKITRCANRAFFRYARINLVIDELDQSLDDFKTDTRIATRQAVDFK
ncbi:Uncharacterised protein [Vibrio cholerae]|nr:Uncharacterised protein [Vibrio cholerae]CSD61472.1 Uncharacterised protein [Vibrio cholerae]